MPISFGPATIITLVADNNTPQPLQQFTGVRLIWPESRTAPPLGVPDVMDFESFGVQIPGYLRDNGGTLEWVMQPAIDPIVQALNAIPGPDGWQSEAAKALYQNIGGTLLGQGVSLVDARNVLTQLYQGAVANFVAAHPQD